MKMPPEIRIELTRTKIIPADFLGSFSDPSCGAVLLFLGTTRRWTEASRVGQELLPTSGDVCETVYLEYEAYESMAGEGLRRLAEEAASRWELAKIKIAHRLGRVEVEEASVAVAVASPHRADAFEAGRWLLDRLKEDVPIWKRDTTPEGQTAWHHPTKTSGTTVRESLTAAVASEKEAGLLLVDRFGRRHRSLRISVTDRCNIRCRYCMSDGPIPFLPKEDLMSFEEVLRFVKIMVKHGVTRLRLTGGEPLLRQQLPVLVKKLKDVSGVEALSITTNGMLLAGMIGDLKEAGLDSVNISLDTLNEATFKRLSRRDGLGKVFEGIDAAIQVGMSVKLNTVLMRSINFEDAIELCEFAWSKDLMIRFIEFMPLDSDRSWERDQMVSGEELRGLIEDRFGRLVPVANLDPARPAREYELESGAGRVGFIDSVSQPFCSGCDRLRITAEGKLRNCLFGRDEWDIGGMFRSGASDDEVVEVVRSAVIAKHFQHGIGSVDFQPPEREMFRIGG